MVSKSDIRVCVEVDDKTANLFSISERSNNDLVIKLNPSEKIRDAGTPSNGSAPDIVSQHISVHCSDKSKTGINAIKLTTVFPNKTEKTIENYTKAIKHHNQYASLYCYRAPVLSSERYCVEPSEKNSIITAYRSQHSTLFYYVCVCGKDATEISASNNYGFKYFDFNRFRVLVIWSYINLMSHHTGFKQVFATMKPEEFPKKLRERLLDSKGQSGAEIIDLYKRAIGEAVKEYASTLNSTYSGESMRDFSCLFMAPITQSPLTAKEASDAAVSYGIRCAKVGAIVIPNFNV